jgi:sortase A
VRRKASLEDLTVEELRRLLVEKRRSARQDRLEHFRRTGRVVTLASDAGVSSVDQLHTDELPESEEDALMPASRSRVRRILDGVLLLVEVAAVCALVFVLLNGFQLLRNLNQESIQAQKLPTLTPTPLIMAVILPSGHIPPDARGITRPNTEEIPEHLRPLVQSLADVPVPTPAPEQANRIQIPAIKVDAPVVLGDGWEQLKKGVGQNLTSVNPGEKGNAIFTAHNDVFGEIFRQLDQLKPGDVIILYTSQRSYTYVVTGTQIVEPTQVEVLDPTIQGTVTLISCYPYLVDNKRIIVKGLLQTGSR